MTKTEQLVIDCADELTKRWEQMLRRPTANATASDVRTLLRLVKAVHRLRRERSVGVRRD